MSICFGGAGEAAACRSLFRSFRTLSRLLLATLISTFPCYRVSKGSLGSRETSRAGQSPLVSGLST